MNWLELKVPPMLQLILLTLAMRWTSEWFVPSPASNELLHVIFIVCLVVGVIFTYLGYMGFRKARTTLNPFSPDKTTSLVTGGVYALSRNPIYFGFLMLLIGAAIASQSWLAVIYPVIFVLYMNRFQIKPEENILSKMFESEYADYLSRTRRWI